MRTITPGEIPTKDLHQFLLASVAPRPIAWASTIDDDGRPNLAPYSFFNAFSSNPPILVFSSNRRVANNTTKDTLYNIQQNGEVVINVVNYDLVRNMTLSSVEFDRGISEFDKAGVTGIESHTVKPLRVAESPVQMECTVKEIITLGDQGGAGHLILCHVTKMHIAENVIDERDRIDPDKIDLMGRMGRAHYVRASGDAIHTIVQSVLDPVIGYDALPEHIKNSDVLTGKQIALLAAQAQVPSSMKVVEVNSIYEEHSHEVAAQLIEEEKMEDALAMLWK